MCSKFRVFSCFRICGKVTSSLFSLRKCKLAAYIIIITREKNIFWERDGWRQTDQSRTQILIGSYNWKDTIKHVVYVSRIIKRDYVMKKSYWLIFSNCKKKLLVSSIFLFIYFYQHGNKKKTWKRKGKTYFLKNVQQWKHSMTIYRLFNFIQLFSCAFLFVFTIAHCSSKRSNLSSEFCRFKMCHHKNVKRFFKPISLLRSVSGIILK